MAQHGRTRTRALLPLCALATLGCSAHQAHAPARVAQARVDVRFERSAASAALAADGGQRERSQPSEPSVVSDFPLARIGRPVLVRIDEAVEARTSSRRSTASSSPRADRALGLAAAIARSHPDIDVRDALDALSRSEPGDGESSHPHGARRDRCRASLLLRIARALPDGQLFVEGTKVLLADTQELHVYVSGVIRPRDIARDDSVSSSQVADAEVEFVGRGVPTKTHSGTWLRPFLAWRNAR